MKTVDGVIDITRYSVEVADVIMRTHFAIKISSILTAEESAYIMDTIVHWTATSEAILSELYQALDPESGVDLTALDSKISIWKKVMEKHVTMCRKFERRFIIFCLTRCESAAEFSLVSDLFLQEQDSQ